MEPKHKSYWSHPAQKAQDGLVQIGGDEFPGLEAAGGTRLNRRGFLGAVGFSFAAAAVTGCTRAPVQNAIPMLAQPPESVPGAAQYYASTCNGCSASCGVLVKVRDGRPIKLEGNPQHALSRGGLCAVGQASILGLYDKERFRAPELQQKPTTWEALDTEIAAALARIRAQRGTVRVLSPTITSPTLRAEIADFLAPFADGKHVTYDVPSHSAILDAHAATHGARLLPSYDFSKAEVIVGFDADFLATWLSPVGFTAAYSTERSPFVERPRMSYHVQFEPRMTVTGAKADHRYAIAPAASGPILSYVVSHIAERAGQPAPAGVSTPPFDRALLDRLVARLWNARGTSLVVSGSNDFDEQVLVNYINHLLGNYGATVTLTTPSFLAQGSDAELTTLLEEIAAGRVDALFIYGANPAYDSPRHADAISRIPLLVSLAERRDETAALPGYVAPDHHYLESWGDAEPLAGHVSLRQPGIRPLGQTRAALESFAAWSGKQQSAYDLLRAFWRAEIHPRAASKATFETFWDQSLHDGYIELAAPSAKVKSFTIAAVRSIVPKPAETTLVLYPSVAMLDGRHAYNPWLHELPDPISKVTWDNYASLAASAAAQLGIAEGDVVRVETSQGALELPAFIQPGQHESVVAVALGYGSRLSARFANIGPKWLDFAPSVGPNGLVGVNAAPLILIEKQQLSSNVPVRSIRKTGRRQPLATTQTHNTLTVPEKLAKFDHDPRRIIQETTLAAFREDPAAGVQEHAESELWPSDHEHNGPRWGMVIDLARCTGCSGCVIACQAENNIPVVGKDEVRRNREMHWLRIDRYYAESAGTVDVAFQPLFCQQCGNAPCETVCPVVATVHSDDGLNQQVYNRCIGTRYCANNCPYKGRRFNWFDYAHDDVLQNLVLNPDVTVRSRGVMEKCTFCVQRIQLAKIAAREEGRTPADGEIQTACQQSCPAGAIVFGDLNDPNSRVSKMMKDPRRYRLLAELGVKPAVGFLTLVRNREAEEQQHG